MKKAIFIFAALLMMVSSIAAVSAYESHIVDIKAHVENALIAEQEYDFGINFPEESRQGTVLIGLSESFLSENQTRVSTVKYSICWEWKPIGDHDALDSDNDTFFEPIWPYITVSDGESEANNKDEAPLHTWVTVANAVASGELFRTSPTSGDLIDEWHLIFDVPVFDDWYNPSTDPLTPSGILYYSDNVSLRDYSLVLETVSDNNSGNFRSITNWVPHADLGGNLKFQVEGFATD